MNYQFKNIVVAGTFDHLHKGHQKLLLTACQSAKEVFCGLTVQEMSRNKVLGNMVQSYNIRERFLEAFIKWRKIKSKVNICPIFNPFGPTLEKKEFEAIIATKETEKTVDLLNKIRREKELSSLKKIILGLVSAKDHKKLSSTRIRLGEVNREGLVFEQIFKNRNLALPFSQRKHFKKPLGQLLKSNTNNLSWLALVAKEEIKKKPTPMIITVGDIVTQGFLRAKTPFSLAVIDYRSRRQSVYPGFHKELIEASPLMETAVNDPGTLSSSVIKKIKQLMPKIIFQQKRAVLEIKGEEDLTVLPLVLLSPLETFIFYGQPDKGIVKVRVTEKIKNKTYSLLNKFRAYS